MLDVLQHPRTDAPSSRTASKKATSTMHCRHTGRSRIPPQRDLGHNEAHLTAPISGEGRFHSSQRRMGESEALDSTDKYGQSSIMSSRDIIRAIEADGWFMVAKAGSHWQFKHASRPGRVTVPHPKRDLPLGTIKSIERQSGVKLR